MRVKKSGKIRKINYKFWQQKKEYCTKNIKCTITVCAASAAKPMIEAGSEAPKPGCQKQKTLPSYYIPNCSSPENKSNKITTGLCIKLVVFCCTQLYLYYAVCTSFISYWSNSECCTARGSSPGLSQFSPTKVEALKTFLFAESSLVLAPSFSSHSPYLPKHRQHLFKIKKILANFSPLIFGTTVKNMTSVL